MAGFFVAGRHRLEAAKRLKWKEIEAVELPETGEAIDNEDLSALAEIAENLHRREITALERAELQARWVEIVGKKQDVSAHIEPKLSKRGRKEGRPEGGINKTASDLNVPRIELQRSVKIASLSPAAKEAAKASGLDDNQSALLKAAKKKTPAEQVELLNVIAEAKSTPAPAPEPQALGAEYARSIEDVRRLWPNSPDDYRQALREIVNED